MSEDEKARIKKKKFGPQVDNAGTKGSGIL